ncbi:MAG: MerR family transcriptional regulator [Candidatus Marinimicrobia bacterium]|nr:MerR family transcriptional regulator [Candidatus Neomarinimicrobiota bacterium]
MKPFVLTISDEEIPYLDETNYIGKPLDSKELNAQLLAKTGGSYDIPLSTLRYYQNIHLIKKPERQGRIALYRFETIFDLLAIRNFRLYFTLTIAEMLEIARICEHLYTTAYVLQRCELNYLVHYGTQTAKILKERVRDIKEGDARDAPLRPPVTVGEAIGIIEDLEYLPIFTALSREDAIPKIRTDFFNLILKGVNPMKIKIEF